MGIPTAEIAKTFSLSFPVTAKGLTVNELNARRPKVKDLRVMAQGSDKDPVGAYNRFLAGLCTVPLEIIDELDLVDFKEVQDWVKDFLPKSED